MRARARATWGCGATFGAPRASGWAPLLLAALLTAACAPMPAAPRELGRVNPVVDVAQRLRELSRLTPEDRQALCSASSQWAPIERELRMRGSIDRADVNSQHFLNALFAQITAYFAAPSEHYPRLASLLQEAADAMAFTELTPFAPAGLPGYNVWNEPAYQQALLLVPVSIALLIVRHEAPDVAPLHDAVVRWGDRLYASASAGRDDFVGRFQGVDRVSIKASGFAFWGNVTNRRDALEAAWRGYTTTLRTIGRGGADTMWAAKGASRLYYANMTWGPLVVAAHALERSGVPDAYQLATGGSRLHEAAEWLVVSMRARGDPILNSAKGEGSRSVVWLELLFANQPAAAALAPEAHRSVERLGLPLYVAFAGGPVSCLYRRLN